MSNQDLKEQAKMEMRRSIVAAMEHAGMSAQEIIEILESAIGVLKSGDTKPLAQMSEEELLDLRIDMSDKAAPYLERIRTIDVRLSRLQKHSCLENCGA